MKISIKKLALAAALAGTTLLNGCDIGINNKDDGESGNSVAQEPIIPTEPITEPEREPNTPHSSHGENLKPIIDDVLVIKYGSCTPQYPNWSDTKDCEVITKIRAYTPNGIIPKCGDKNTILAMRYDDGMATIDTPAFLACQDLNLSPDSEIPVCRDKTDKRFTIVSMQDTTYSKTPYEIIYPTCPDNEL